MTDRCRKCGSGHLEVKRMLAGHSHFASRRCLDCGDFLWLPRPARALTRNLIAALAPSALPLDAPLPALEGTPAQSEYAAKLRALALPRLRRVLDPDLFRLARGIAGAGWWIANREKPPLEIRWPAAWFEADVIPGDGTHSADA